MRQRAKHPRNIALDQVLPRTARERKKLAKRFRGLFTRAAVADLYADGRARSRVSVRAIFYDYPRKRSSAIEAALLAELLARCLAEERANVPEPVGAAGLYADGRARSRVFVRTIYPQVPEPVYETILGDSEATATQTIEFANGSAIISVPRTKDQLRAYGPGPEVIA